MLKTEKSTLKNKLLDLVKCIPITAPTPAKVVIDGGWLLHKIPWIRNTAVVEILQQYVLFIRNKFQSDCTIIFDGYGEENIKDHEHRRRRSDKICCDVHLRPDSINKFDQTKFLANETNKMQLVNLLSSRLQQDGHLVLVSRGDADTMIASQALHLAKEDDVDVICSDTDVLCLLVQHTVWKTENHRGKIFFRKEPQSGRPHTGGRFSIDDISDALHPQQAQSLLLLHAWTGADTTSALFHHGKLGLFHEITKSENLARITREISKEEKLRKKLVP